MCGKNHVKIDIRENEMGIWDWIHQKKKKGIQMRGWWKSRKWNGICTKQQMENRG